MKQRETDWVGEVAVVIGGSMAGLLAARILSERYAQVLVLERDANPEGAVPRKGVPQGQHAHALLARGNQVLEELFPGLTEQLVKAGAVRGFGRFFSNGGMFYPVRRGAGSLYVSRPLLETEVRRRLLTIANVRMVERCNVLNLVMDEGKKRVCGVRVQHRGVESSTETLAANLVVDASGRASRMEEWLKALGYPTPEVELMEVGMGYATRVYRREAHHLNGDLMVNIAPSAANKRACGMMAQEGDRWMVTLAGYFGDHPPTDEAGFLAFAKSLPIPDVYEVIRSATPLNDAIAYKFPSNQRRRYEALTRFPTGLLVIGDAICSFTPIYGQGMSIAAQEALVLREVLAAGTDRLAQRYFQQIAKVVDVAWNLTVGNDKRLAGKNHSRSLGKRLLDGYVDKLQIAARRDPEVAWAFLKVGSLLAPPASLLHPAVVLRVAWDGIRALGNLIPTRSRAMRAARGF